MLPSGRTPRILLAGTLGILLAFVTIVWLSDTTFSNRPGVSCFPGGPCPWGGAIDLEGWSSRSDIEPAQAMRSIPPGRPVLWHLFPVDGGMKAFVDVSVNDTCDYPISRISVHGNQVVVTTGSTPTSQDLCDWHSGGVQWEERFIALPPGRYDARWDRGDHRVQEASLSVAR